MCLCNGEPCCKEWADSRLARVAAHCTSKVHDEKPPVQLSHIIAKKKQRMYRTFDVNL